jgi:hypothetical protein
MRAVVTRNIGSLLIGQEVSVSALRTDKTGVFALDKDGKEHELNLRDILIVDYHTIITEATGHAASLLKVWMIVNGVRIPEGLW